MSLSTLSTIGILPSKGAPVLSLQRLWANPQYLISGQVLNEFANVAMKKLALTEEEVLAYITEFRCIKTVETRSCLTDRALGVKKEYGLQFYDSLVLATAEAYECDELLTEDLNEGQVYGGVRVVNPFRDR